MEVAGQADQQSLTDVVVRFGRPNGIVDGPHFDLIGARIK